MDGENTNITTENRQKLFNQWVDEGSIGLFEDFLKANTTENTEVKGEREPPIVKVKAVIDENNEDAIFLAESKQALATAYGENEPDYSQTPPKETNPFIKPTERKPSQSSRFSGMVNFSGEKGKIVTAIIENGITQGYWKTKQQFYEKVFDFAINSQLVHAHLNITDAYIFGVPDDVETKLFTNGYYENDSKLKLPTC